MFFRNLSLYRFPDGCIDASTFADQLAEMPLREVGKIELASQGFVSPITRASELTLAVGDCILFAFAVQEHILPPAVIADELGVRLAAIADREDRRVGGKERRRIKEEIISEFLPRAFTRTRRTLAYVDVAGGWLVVDTATRAVAEAVISSLRDALGRFPAVPLTPQESPRALMTDWLVSNKLPGGIGLGEECELRDPAEAGAVVRCARQDLESDEVGEHLRSGKQVFRLGLVFGDRLSLVLGEDLGIKKLRFLDAVLDELDAGTAESIEAEVTSCFALMTLELQHLFDWISLTFQAGRLATLTLDGGDAPKHMREASRARANGTTHTLHADGTVTTQFVGVSDSDLDRAVARDPGNVVAVKRVKAARGAKAAK